MEIPLFTPYDPHFCGWSVCSCSEQTFPSTKENTRAPVQRVSGRHLSSSHPSFYQHLTSPWTSNRGPELKLTMTTDDEPVLHIAFRRRSSSHFGSTTQYVSAHVPGPSSWLNPRVFSAPLHRPDDAEDSMARSFPDPTSEKKIWCFVKKKKNQRSRVYAHVWTKLTSCLQRSRVS